MADSPFPLGTFLGIGQSLFNHALSESSAVDAHNRQIKFWNMQNEYNSPTNQRKRMQQAGMNPIDNVQSVPAGELSSVPENQFAHNGTFDIVSQLEAFSHIEKMGSETDLLAQQFKNAIIEEAIKQGELFGVKLDNDQKKILLKYYDSKQSAQLRKLLAEIDNTESSTAYNEAAAGEKRASAFSIESKLPYEIDSLKAGIDEKKANTKKLLTEESYIKAKEITENELRQYEKEYRAASTLEAKSQASLNYVNARLNNIKANLEEKYGDRERLAETLTKESAAEYADDINESLVELRNTAAQLNRDNVRHNEAIEDIQKEANRIRAEFNKLYATGLVTDSIFNMIDKATGSLDDVLSLLFN